jgi:hypothetical protein
LRSLNSEFHTDVGSASFEGRDSKDSHPKKEAVAY